MLVFDSAKVNIIFATGVKCCFHNEYAPDYAQTQHSAEPESPASKSTLLGAAYPFYLVLCHYVLLQMDQNDAAEVVLKALFVNCLHALDQRMPAVDICC